MKQLVLTGGLQERADPATHTLEAQASAGARGCGMALYRKSERGNCSELLEGGWLAPLEGSWVGEGPFLNLGAGYRVCLVMGACWECSAGFAVFCENMTLSKELAMQSLRHQQAPHHSLFRTHEALCPQAPGSVF